MASNRWLGQAIAVAQVDTVQVTAFDASTTYKLTVNSIDIVSEVGVTDEDTTAANMSAAWNLSTHPYATGITASVATDTVTLTADNAGEPFTVTSSVVGGTGTIGSVTNSIANDGPNVWDSANNWENGVPSNTDDVAIEQGSVDIRWGIDQSGMSGTYASFKITKAYSGKIGLNRNAFFVANAEDASVSEYRQDYLKIKCAVVGIGENLTGQSKNGSKRVKLDVGTTATVIRVHSTPNSGDPSGNQPLMILANSASTDIFSYGGRVGVAVDVGETSTVRKITPTGGSLVTGDGLTLTTWESNGGAGHRLQAAATLTTLTATSGDVTTDGSFAITTMNVSGGTVNSNSTGTITTANLNSGTLDFVGNDQTRTVTTLTIKPGGNLRANQDAVTYTNEIAISGDSSTTLKAT